MMRRYWLVALVMAGLLFACSPAPQAELQVLPTLAPLVLPPDLSGAMGVALNFLENWRVGDYPAMYALTTFSSQEAVTLDAFTAAYQNTHDEMTLESLSYTPVTLSPDSARSDVAVFNYNLAFETRLIGSLSDENRNMALVFDPNANDWRVAWTPGDIFAELSRGGQLRLEISVPSRANIYDRNGRILADQQGRIVIVRAIKQAITDWPSCLALLAPAMSKEPADVQKIYDQSSPDWLMELGTIEPITYDQLHTQLEAICAAQFDSRPTRHYDNGTVAANIVGTVGYPDEVDLPAVEADGFNSDSILGKSGIERSWDETLRGRPGGRLLIVGPSGDVLRQIAQNASQPAESVWLTIDSALQTKIQQIIADYYTTFELKDRSKGAAVVMMDVHTGEILAMVSYPTYNADVFAPFPSMGRAEATRLIAQLQADPRRPLLNRATQGVYPLGSVMKTVSATAAGDTGVFTLDQRFVCTGTWTREDNFTRYDWLPSGHGTVTLASALTQSCNPFFYEVGYQLNQIDPEALPGYMKQAGFGLLTGLTDVAEQAGFIPDPAWKRQTYGLDWTFSDAVNISIGQGEVQVTPLQVARWFAAIANGGTLYRPLLVGKTAILGDAPGYTLTPDPMHQLDMNPAVMNIVREGLCNVTTARSGTAEFIFRDSELQTIGVCGKTGTAQDVPRPTHAWFAAYAPREEPEVAIVVVVENGGQGSEVAAPIVRDILEHYFFESQRG